MRTLFCAVLFLSVVSASYVSAQPGGRGGRGGGDGGDGGFGGGRGGFGGFGGGRGGPTQGGFGGGRGGPTQGGFGGGRGGPTQGGFGGGRGGSGFNPADMVKRFDRNGNGMIDPDENTGMASMFLQRMAANNPKIDLKKPVPIELITGEIDRMRGGGRRDSGDSQESDEPELLVPDFSLDFEPQPIPGFGASSELFTVKVTDRDLKEAEERMRRYDSNRDNKLSKDELRRGRWSDDPMTYDRNKDGQVSVAELAVRYANRRIDEQEREDSRGDSRSSRGGWGGGRTGGGWQQASGGESEEEEVARFGEAKSFRTTETRSVGSGLPDFFNQRDADGDGQVLMNEFSSSWNAETLAEFLKWDLNGDGIIEPRECLAAVRNGSSSASSASSSAASPTGGSTPSSAGKTVDAQFTEWAQRQISKYDKNRDGQLTVDEWKEMYVKPVDADTNGDGVITLEEYAIFRSKK